MFAFRLPDLGEGTTEAEVIRWLVEPGATVKLDQPLAEVQTDKVMVEIPSPVAGRVVSIPVEAGTVVPVGTVLIEIDEQPQTSAMSSKDQLSALATQAQGSSVGLAYPMQDSTSTPGVDGGNLTRRLAAPAVRRMARESGLNLASVAGTGPAGRITADDVRRAAAPPHSDATNRPESHVSPITSDGEAEERIPLRGLRRVIAENMVRSASTIPQITSMIEVDASGLVALRESARDAAEAHGAKLTYLPFIVKALVQTLKLYPYVNAMLDDASNEIVLKRHYHIGIATATSDGLLIPVIRHADRLTV
ncbi:MAG: dienelactone hydrolase, partial [Chloroflexi bacterium]|nr:dienelactone hydrolase [Chloroflexota bacterium]